MVTFGTDVEFGLYLKSNGNWLSPYEEDSNYLAEHFMLEEFENIHPDGTNYEVVIPPQDNISDLLMKTRAQILRAAQRVNCNPSFLPIQVVDYSKVSHVDEVNIFGCQPDIDFMGKDIDTGLSGFKDRARGLDRRPAGGHIHISSPYMFRVTNDSWASFIKLFEEFQKQEVDAEIKEYGLLLQQHKCWNPFIQLGSVLASLILDFSYNCSLSLYEYSSVTKKQMIKMENERRENYGKPMKSRPKMYPHKKHGILQGIEIRSASPTMFLADPYQSLVKDLNSDIKSAMYTFPYKTAQPIEDALHYLSNFPKTVSSANVLPASDLRFDASVCSYTRIPEIPVFNGTDKFTRGRLYDNIGDIIRGTEKE